MKSIVVTVMALASVDPVLTDSRLGAAGVGARLRRAAVEAGLLRKVGPHAHVLGGPAAPSLDLLAAAAAAAAHRDGCAVGSHRSAAACWGAPGVVVAEPEVTVVAPTVNRVEGAIVHRTDHLAATDRTRISSALEVTSPPKTMLDLGAVCPPDVVERAFEHLYFHDLITWRQAKGVLERCGGRGRRGAGVFRAILEARDPALAPPASELERAVAKLLRREGIRVHATQVEVVGYDGSKVVVDFLVGPRKVIEADGYAWHSSRADKRRNERKLQLLVLAGYQVLPCSWVDLQLRRQAFAAEVRAFVRSPAAAAA